MLECNHVMKKYLSVTAVEDITLRLEPGLTYALLGPNGSGKTTFMKMVAGLIKPTSGTILFEDQEDDNFSKTQVHEIGPYSKAHIAYMPTESYFYPYMTCKVHTIMIFLKILILKNLNLCSRIWNWI